MHFEIAHVLLLSLTGFFRRLSIFLESSFLCLVGVAVGVATPALLVSRRWVKDRAFHVVNVVLGLPIIVTLIRLVIQKLLHFALVRCSLLSIFLQFFFLLFSGSFVLTRIFFRPTSSQASFTFTSCLGILFGLLFLGLWLLEEVAEALFLGSRVANFLIASMMTLLTIALMAISFFLNWNHRFIVKAGIFLR